MTPNDGFAKVHYGFILKAQNRIAESIPYLKVTAVVCFPYTLSLKSFEIPFGHGFQWWLLTDWHALLSLPCMGRMRHRQCVPPSD